MYPVKHTCWFDIYKNIDKIPLVNCPVLIIHTSRSLYGALIGSVLAFNVADYLGRRRELVSTALLYLVGALVIALAPNLSILVIGRFVYGIGIGLNHPAIVVPRLLAGLTLPSPLPIETGNGKERGILYFG
ncbi:hypothetical protein Ahy_A01g002488 [Arachis hypogaea]|uniref:Major facilitator superfamily (MFS) profile domain-containing protein n=1 Tax=Arachis hypogaea TaxID=3818 RepID=A0A445EQS5_ARAHY|nr:hypothetical protein Ahy_A01g002488 [Arachis hypogaea]